MTMNKKDIAESFLQLASSGNVRTAYEKCVHLHFRHHNAYFKGDRESLLVAMEDNAREFPGKTYETLRMLEDGNLVAVHGKVMLAQDSEWSVIHIFRFNDDLIIEAWEASQQVLKDSPNENGIF
ncbi:MAG: nuclear transport factor 2 family protein [Candidatus Aminicenantes bacterium]|nr:nuclear transport factor 2 family protein [Candidatus Aminicenantes bacterium]